MSFSYCKFPQGLVEIQLLVAKNNRAEMKFGQTDGQTDGRRRNNIPLLIPSAWHKNTRTVMYGDQFPTPFLLPYVKFTDHF